MASKSERNVVVCSGMAMLELEPLGEDTMHSRGRYGFAYVFWPSFASSLINRFNHASLITIKV